MKAYIGRQPIFDTNYQIVGYELLYRDEQNKNCAVVTDGDIATTRLLSDAITVFGLTNITGNKLAFVNFTETLLKNDFALLVNPDEILVEILENVEIDDKIVEKIIELKENGYKVAIDDYVGDYDYELILPYIDIIKVDFMDTDENQQKEFASLLKRYSSLSLLAEKVETEEEYKRALKQGYTLFQGYYFEKPSTLDQDLPKMSFYTFNNLMLQLIPGQEINFYRCAGIIRRDPLLTYRLLKKMLTLQYYRGNEIVDVKMALVTMGEDGLRRWLLLMLARDNNVTHSIDLPKKAFIRGYFSKRIVEKSRMRADPEIAFIIGMFSFLDKITGKSLSELLREIEVPDLVSDVLVKKKKNVYTKLLSNVCAYEDFESKKESFDFKFPLSEKHVWKIYMEALKKADEEFSE